MLVAARIGATTTTWSKHGEVFAPAISEYAVTFGGKPTITEFDTVTISGDTVKGVRAELKSPVSFQRVEVVPRPPGFSSIMTKESAIAMMTEFAQHNGLRGPLFTWEVTPIGKRLSMRATKIVMIAMKIVMIATKIVMKIATKIATKIVTMITMTRK